VGESHHVDVGNETLRVDLWTKCSEQFVATVNAFMSKLIFSGFASRYVSESAKFFLEPRAIWLG
jgi:hypothetical protein